MITWITIGTMVAGIAGLWRLGRRRHESTGVHRTPSPYAAPTQALVTPFPATQAYGVIRPDQLAPGYLEQKTLGRHYRDETAEMPAINGYPRHAGDA